jgi:hypothetical protein
MPNSLEQREGRLSQPMVSLTVGRQTEQRYIADVQILQDDCKHTVAMVTVWYFRPRRNGQLVKEWKPNLGFWREGSNVVLKWGWSPRNVNVLYGYAEGRKIHMKEKEDGRVPVTFVVRGTSRTMQTSVRKNWGNVTASYVARRIAKKYGLRARIDKTDVVYEDLTQHESDFKFLVRMAERSGNRLWINNGELHFIDPYRALHTSHTGYPTFRMSLEPNRRDTLRALDVATGALMPEGGQATDFVTYLSDPATGNVMPVREQYRSVEALLDVNAEPDPDVEIHFSQISAQTYQEAKSLLKAEKKKNRNWISATATTIGDPRVQPGSVIMLTGTGLTRHEEGLWFVHGVTHRLERVDPQEPRSIEYEMDLVLGRDRDAEDVTHDDTPLPVTPVPQVPVTNINGRWRAVGCGDA